MKSVLVTGGAGFIGSNLVRELVRNPSFEVTVIDDLSTGLLSNLSGIDIQIIQEDISNPDASIYKNKDGFDTIIHLAARGSVPRSIKEPLLTTKVNLIGTQNLLELARHKSSHFIFSSSSSVYGQNLKLPKDEKDWTQPLSPYAASKAAAEAYVFGYSSSYGFPSSVFRFFNIFGPWQRPNHVYSAVIPKWIWAAMNNQEVEVFGDGEQTRDFTYVRTVTDVLIEAISQKDPNAGVVNLAYGNRISLNSLIDNLKGYFQDLSVTYSEPRKGDVLDSQNNPKLVEALFPKCTPVTFNEGLAETIEWLKAHKKTIESA
jgi:UDP-glucose 4-epimerase